MREISRRCGSGVACPGVFEKDKSTLVVIGRRADDETRALLPAGRIGEDETAIEIPRDLIAGLGGGGEGNVGN